MLALCFAFVQANLYKAPGVVTITDKNFERIVLNRDNDSIIMVMFHGEHCPACHMAYPTFASAAKKMTGIATFGHVDCSRNQLIPARFRIRAIPTFYVFHPNGINTYDTWTKWESSFINGVMDRVPDLVEKADQTWAVDDTKSKMAILFTRKWTLPPIWKALAWNLSTTGVKFAWANDRKTKAAYGVTTSEIIEFRNGDKKESFRGAVNFEDVRRATLDFFEGEMDAKKEL